jgi:hypothetical protein
LDLMHFSYSSPEQNQVTFVSWAIIVSILLHIAAVSLYLISLKSIQTSRIPKTYYTVEFSPEVPKQQRAPKEKKQIVDAETQIQPPNDLPAFQAEKDNFTLNQQIRRGDDMPAVQAKQKAQTDATAQQKPVFQKQEQKQEIEKKAVPKDLKLKLDSGDMADFYEQKKPTKNQAQENIQAALSAQSNPKIAAGVDVSRLGSRDFLADIPDGDVTLLNAKANKFAVFVRRVASQVFANLKGSGWHSLSVADINAIESEAIYEAVLSPKGNLISVTQIDKSGSRFFDQVLATSIQKGAKDPNPPAGAEAEDGNIHFTFQAKSWVQIKNNPRTGTPVQRRWLLLGTGLD